MSGLTKTFFASHFVLRDVHVPTGVYVLGLWYGIFLALPFAKEFTYFRKAGGPAFELWKPPSGGCPVLAFCARAGMMLP